MRQLLVFVLACAIHAASAQAPASHPAMTSIKEINNVAQQSLSVLAQLVTETNYRTLGFESASEAKAARAESPFPIYMVRLDSLRAFTRGSDPAALLTPLDKAIVPLSVQGEVRSSVTVELRGSKWTAEGFGSPKLARALSKARKDASASAPADSYFAVHVAALNSYFLGHRAGGRLMLTTVVDDANLKLPAGRTLAAEEIFATLATVAQQHNDLPT